MTRRETLQTRFFKYPCNATRFALGIFAVAMVLPAAQAQAEPPAELAKALSFRPRQADVDYEKVADADIEQCSIEVLKRPEGQGFWVTGPSGQALRWFVDTNGDNKPDRWSYYSAGVEVYRESDTDFNKVADEFRWLNTAGMRWGIDKDEDGQIDTWKIISAQEVTSEVVAAAAERDADRFARLLISDDEIEKLALGKEKAELLEQRVSDAREQFGDWVRGQNVVSSSSKWTNFGADKPGIVPAGTDGSSQDVRVYENVVALLDNAGDARQLLVGTLIQVGDTWRIIELPRAVSEGAVVSEEGVFFSASFNPREAASPAPEASGGISKAMERLVTDLQDIDTQLLEEGDKEKLHSRRADVLEKLISASESPEDRGTWIRQFAETVSAAAQTGEYPDGIKRLHGFARKLTSAKASQNDVAYVVFRTITADYNNKMMQPKAKYEELQKEYLNDLVGFVKRYPTSGDSAEAMIQIALSAEFSGETKTAEQWYAKASKSFGSTLAGQKATGALRRLGLEGKPFSVEQTTIDGRSFKSSSYLGGPVVYHCWASWCDGCKAEMRALKQLQAKYAKNKVRIVGINLDNSPDVGRQFLKDNAYPWVHLYDSGGLDSELAVSYGILTLPVNVIVDKSGKVVKTGVHWTEIDGVLETLVK